MIVKPCVVSHHTAVQNIFDVWCVGSSCGYDNKNKENRCVAHRCGLRETGSTMRRQKHFTAQQACELIPNHVVEKNDQEDNDEHNEEEEWTYEVMEPTYRPHATSSSEEAPANSALARVITPWLPACSTALCNNVIHFHFIM